MIIGVVGWFVVGVRLNKTHHIGFLVIVKNFFQKFFGIAFGFYL
jgi:hypothetical protein